MADTDFGTDTLAGFLDRVAAHTPAPGGGAAAAVTTSLAAGLVAMAGHFSACHCEESGRIIGQADQLRAKALDLAAQDALAYGEVLAAYRLTKDDPDRPSRIRSALERAADVPLAIARVGATVATLGAVLARSGNPNLHGDAVIAVTLADAAARGAACLVELNVSLGDLDGHRLDELADTLKLAADAAAQVSGAP